MNSKTDDNEIRNAVIRASHQWDEHIVHLRSGIRNVRQYNIGPQSDQALDTAEQQLRMFDTSIAQLIKALRQTNDEAEK